MNRHIVPRDMKAFGNFQLGAAIVGRKIDIENVAALLAMKMAMLMHIGTITHGGAVEIYFFDQTTFHQEIQTVVDGRHGNIGQRFLGAHKHLLSGGVIAILEQHTIDVLALRGEAKTFEGQTLHQRGLDC